MTDEIHGAWMKSQAMKSYFIGLRKAKAFLNYDCATHKFTVMNLLTQTCKLWFFSEELGVRSEEWRKAKP